MLLSAFSFGPKDGEESHSGRNWNVLGSPVLGLSPKSKPRYPVSHWVTLVTCLTLQSSCVAVQ